LQEKLTFPDSLTIKDEDNSYERNYRWYEKIQSIRELQDPEPEGVNVFTLFFSVTDAQDWKVLSIFGYSWNIALLDGRL